MPENILHLSYQDFGKIDIYEWLTVNSTMNVVEKQQLVACKAG
jgi:hypothetical protein